MFGQPAVYVIRKGDKLWVRAALIAGGVVLGWKLRGSAAKSSRRSGSQRKKSSGKKRKLRAVK